METIVSHGHTEKRSFLRIAFPSPVEFFITTEKTKKTYHGSGVNLSGGGICFETDKKLEVGSKLNLTLPSTTRKTAPLSAPAEVIRVSTLPGKKKVYLIAARLSQAI